MLKAKKEVFAPTDGVVKLYSDTPAREARALDWRTTEGLALNCELPFRAMRLRADDVEQAVSTGCALDLKLAVRAPEVIDASMTCAVGERLLDIVRLERESRITYLYLQEEVSDGLVTLIKTTNSYNDLGEWTETTKQVDVVAKSVALSSKEGDPQVSIVVRTCDYKNETRLKRGDISYTVTAAAGDGRWTQLTCIQEVKDRG